MRAPLRKSIEVFDARGAAQWSKRARQELRATGAKVGQRLESAVVPSYAMLSIESLDSSERALGRGSIARKEIKHVSDKPNIVLVHGAWADGSYWSAVIESLQARGYMAIAPQFPETSLAADARVSSPAILVGHSHAGSLITAAGYRRPRC
jgi:pimeloyl-ACP methyl ester carboxylesterase